MISERILPVFHITAVLSVDPLRPAGQQGAVSKAELPLNIGLVYSEFALAGLSGFFPFKYCRDAQLKPCDALFLKPAAVDIETHLIRL